MARWFVPANRAGVATRVEEYSQTRSTKTQASGGCTAAQIAHLRGGGNRRRAAMSRLVPAAPVLISGVNIARPDLASAERNLSAAEVRSWSPSQSFDCVRAERWLFGIAFRNPHVSNPKSPVFRGLETCGT